MTITLDMIDTRLGLLSKQEAELWAQLNACRGAASELRSWRELAAAPVPGKTPAADESFSDLKITPGVP